MKNALIIIILLSASFFAKAQDTLKHYPQPDSLIKVSPFSEGRRGGYLYTIDNKFQSPDDIKAKLLSYGPSAIEYKVSRNNFTWSLISLGGVTACGVAALIEFKNTSKYNNASPANINGQAGFVYQHRSNTAAYIFTGAATGFFFAEIFTLIKGAHHRNKAFKVYNQRFE